MNEEQYLTQLRRLWRENWPQSLPQEPEYPFGEATLTEYLRRWAELTPDKPALIFYGAEMTYRDLDELSSRFAGLLQSLGASRGDRIAVFLSNCPQFLIAFYGILKLGCVHVPVNPLFKEQELLYELSDSGARIAVCADSLYPLVEAVRGEAGLGEVISTSPAEYVPERPAITVPDALRAPRRECPGATDMLLALEDQPAAGPSAEPGLDELAALNYTGGTTGLPKGCEHTQRDMLYTAATAATYNFERLGPDDVVLAYLPVFWIAGEDTGVLLPVFSGAPHVLLARWDARAALEAIDRYGVSATGGVVDNFVELMERPDAANYDLTSVRTLQLSSFVKKVNLEYRRKWAAVSGSPSTLREAAYGMTETHTFDTFTTGLQTSDADLKSQPLFCGLPQPGTEFAILDFDTGEFAPLGAEGEIAVRSPSLLKRYWNKPEATAESLKDGWLLTGDIGTLDEQGFLHFLGRRKEMLKVKGMSVFPAEIETLLGGHPSIAGSGVVGAPDEHRGEVPVAFVQLRTGEESVDEASLAAWCAENMASYKVPVVRIVEELPMTATGKVKKEPLQSRLLQERQSDGA